MVKLKGIRPIEETPLEYATKWFKDYGCPFVEPTPYQTEDVCSIVIQKPRLETYETVIIRTYNENEERPKELTERQHAIAIAASYIEQRVSIFTVKKTNDRWKEDGYSPYIETLHKPK
jgi:hypothetical protein